MEDQINRLRAMEASSGSPDASGFNTLYASGVSAQQAAAAAGGARAKEIEGGAAPATAATATVRAAQERTAAAAGLAREPFPGDVTRMEVAAQVRLVSRKRRGGGT